MFNIIIIGNNTNKLETVFLETVFLEIVFLENNFLFFFKVSHLGLSLIINRSFIKLSRGGFSYTDKQNEKMVVF